MPYSNTTTWIFDLDNTLYDDTAGIFEEITSNSLNFMKNEHGESVYNAHLLTADEYWQVHGGHIANKLLTGKICHKKYYNYIFDNLSIEKLVACATTKELINKLPGKKVIFTNAEKSYAKKVLKHLDMQDIFKEIYDFTWTGFRGKEDIKSYEKLLKELKTDAINCIMVEDTVRNLPPAKKLGMKTVLIKPNKINYDFVDEQAENVLSWLVNVNQKINFKD